MKRGNFRILLLEIFLIAIFFFALFAPRMISRYLVALTLIITTIILDKKVRIKSNDYIYEKQVTIMMSVFALIYLAIYYATGLYFGFVRSAFSLNITAFIRIILPISLITIWVELLRKILLSQDCLLVFKGKKINLSVIFTFILTVLADLIIYVGIYNVETLDNVLKIVGFVIFASISCNLLYQYLSVRFGPKGIISYRLIIVLAMYVIPVQPDVFTFLRSFFRMIYPFIMYLILEATYAKKKSALLYKQRKKNIWQTIVTILIMTQLIMLISCKFKYGIIVIGSESMTGTINMGDAIIYERYDGGPIKQGQVIMFEKGDIRIVHRAIKVSNIDGKINIITKGDANKEIDNWTLTQQDIKGLVKLRIRYIGIPTIWVNKLFN